MSVRRFTENGTSTRGSHIDATSQGSQRNVLNKTHRIDASLRYHDNVFLYAPQSDRGSGPGASQKSSPSPSRPALKRCPQTRAGSLRTLTLTSTTSTRTAATTFPVVLSSASCSFNQGIAASGFETFPIAKNSSKAEACTGTNLKGTGYFNSAAMHAVSLKYAFAALCAHHSRCD